MTNRNDQQYYGMVLFGVHLIIPLIVVFWRMRRWIMEQSIGFIGIVMITGGLLWIVWGGAVLLNVRRRQQWAIRCKIVSFAVLPMLLLLVFVEGMARLAWTPPNRAPLEMLQNLYDPKVQEAIRDKRTAFGQLNSHGFRSREFDFEKASDVFSIVILGGSVGTGAWAGEFANTPAAYLETHLQDFIRQKYGKRLQVYCLAESGDDIEDEGFWLLKLGLQLQPDLVISITGYNNMFNALLSYWDFGSGGRGFKRPGLIFRPQSHERIDAAALNFLVVAATKIEDASYFVQWVKEAGSRLFHTQNEVSHNPIKNHLAAMSQTEKPENIPSEAIRRFRQCADNLYRLCQANQIPYVVVLQPFRGAGQQRLAQLPPDGSQDDRDQFLYRTMISVWKEFGPTAYPTFDASEKVADQIEAIDNFADSCHMWDKGFILFNDAVLAWLQESVL